MRNCDNCQHGSYGLDCNTGIEALYCTESGYEFETYPDSVCEYHQFIDGYEDEKNYMFYDENYLGPGIFIVDMKENDINQIMKIYVDKRNGMPNYRLRAFNYGLEDEYFNGVEFIFRKGEDDKIFDVFNMFLRNSERKIETRERNKKEKDYILMTSDKSKFKLIVQKMCDNLKENYVDINLADLYSCKHYGAVSSLYNSLVSISPVNKDENVKILVKNKLN